jgi:hypothetical protein
MIIFRIQRIFGGRTDILDNVNVDKFPVSGVSDIGQLVQSFRFLVSKSLPIMTKSIESSGESLMETSIVKYRVTFALTLS